MGQGGQMAKKAGKKSADAKSGKPNILARYWGLLKRPSTIAMGLVLGFGFVAGIIFWGGFNTVLDVTNTEKFCISCHVMRDNVYPEYKGTIHHAIRSGVRASCPDCHVPHEWTDKIVRKVQASKEVWGAILGTINTREKFLDHRLYLATREWKRFKKNDSLECRNCHDQSFMNFKKQGAPGVFMHTTMIDTGKFTCVDCHKGIAHQLPELVDLEKITPATLEPTMRPPYDHAKSTLE